MAKRKNRYSGLNEGGCYRTGAKKVKTNKENFTAYIAPIESESEEDRPQPVHTFSSLPVHGTYTVHPAPRTMPEPPPLRPFYPDIDFLPNLEPISDDEDYGGDAADDEHEDFDLDEYSYSPGWDDAVYEEANHNLNVPTHTTTSGPLLAFQDHEMPFQPYEQPPPINVEPTMQSNLLSSLSSFLPDVFVNPWRPETSILDPRTTAPPPTDPWCFSMSGDIDDEYLEEYSNRARTHLLIADPHEKGINSISSRPISLKIWDRQATLNSNRLTGWIF
ncbi:hypothetical protein B0H12DRAFT_1117194 [Mycena haematopus]|nr:hypothetical protein B0H12DRAFT_1117194 [Mycena haematopus]